MADLSVVKPDANVAASAGAAVVAPDSVGNRELLERLRSEVNARAAVRDNPSLRTAKTVLEPRASEVSKLVDQERADLPRTNNGAGVVARVSTGSRRDSKLSYERKQKGGVGRGMFSVTAKAQSRRANGAIGSPYYGYVLGTGRTAESLRVDGMTADQGFSEGAKN